MFLLLPSTTARPKIMYLLLTVVFFNDSLIKRPSLHFFHEMTCHVFPVIPDPETQNNSSWSYTRFTTTPTKFQFIIPTLSPLKKLFFFSPVSIRTSFLVNSFLSSCGTPCHRICGDFTCPMCEDTSRNITCRKRSPMPIPHCHHYRLASVAYRTDSSWGLGKTGSAIGHWATNSNQRSV